MRMLIAALAACLAACSGGPGGQGGADLSVAAGCHGSITGAVSATFPCTTVLQQLAVEALSLRPQLGGSSVVSATFNIEASPRLAAGMTYHAADLDANSAFIVTDGGTMKTYTAGAGGAMPRYGDVTVVLSALDPATGAATQVTNTHGTLDLQMVDMMDPGAGARITVHVGF